MARKWAHLQKEIKKVTLPTRATDGSSVIVSLREPDITTSLLTGGITLPDSLFAMFAHSTQEGEQNKADHLRQFSENPDAGQGLLDFLDILVKAAFVEPKLVDSEEEADWETTVPVSAFNMIDKMFVMECFPEVFNQLSGLQTFRTESDGVTSPALKSD